MADRSDIREDAERALAEARREYDPQDARSAEDQWARVRRTPPLVRHDTDPLRFLKDLFGFE